MTVGPRTSLALSVVLLMTAWPSGQAATRSLLEARHERVVVQKWDLSCGAASLATILKYQFGEPVTERDVALALMRRKEYLANPSLVRARQGFSLLDLQRAVDRLPQYKGVGLGRLSLPDLIERAPMIVPVKVHGYSHFVVFRGVYRGHVLIADPSWGNRTMSVASFARMWSEFPGMGRIGFYVVPRHGKPPANRLAPREADIVTVSTEPDEPEDLDVVRRIRAPILLTEAAMDGPVGSADPGASPSPPIASPGAPTPALPPPVTVSPIVGELPAVIVPVTVGPAPIASPVTTVTTSTVDMGTTLLTGTTPITTSLTAVTTSVDTAMSALITTVAAPLTNAVTSAMAPVTTSLTTVTANVTTTAITSPTTAVIAPVTTPATAITTAVGSPLLTAPLTPIAPTTGSLLR
jgi:predicted double-glycine peptidase